MWVDQKSKKKLFLALKEFLKSICFDAPQEMKTPRRAAYGILFAIGMILYFGLAIGAFQYLHFTAAIVWIPVLVILGFLIRRRFLRSIADALTSLGFGLLFSSLTVIGLGIFTGSEGFSESLWSKVQGIALIYGILFWLPFATGLLLGGIRHNKKTEQIGDASTKKAA